MSDTRPFNFNPGPSTLPLPALRRAQDDLLDFAGTGMSILEHSHRGQAYEAVHQETIDLLTALYGIPDTHQVLFMQGGASAQFAMVPMNFRAGDHAGDYVITGTWSAKALKEAKVLGTPHVAWDNPADNGTYTRVPKSTELQLSAGTPYVHVTTNNTIMGTQFSALPDTGKTPLVLDMSSDFLSRPVDFSNIGFAYAGAQKNAGPAGITIAIIRKDFLERSRTDLPYAFRYAEVAKANSLQNTIPTFAVYLVRNVLAWLQDEGGVSEIELRNRRKAALIYDAIDESRGYYRCPVETASRSLMNVVFRLPDEALEREFVAKAAAQGLLGLKGHRSVGGIRASLYNAMPIEGATQLATFMNHFRRP